MHSPEVEDEKEQPHNKEMALNSDSELGEAERQPHHRWVLLISRLGLDKAGQPSACSNKVLCHSAGNLKQQFRLE